MSQVALGRAFPHEVVVRVDAAVRRAGNELGERGPEGQQRDGGGGAEPTMEQGQLHDGDDHRDRAPACAAAGCGQQHGHHRRGHGGGGEGDRIAAHHVEGIARGNEHGAARDRRQTDGEGQRESGRERGGDHHDPPASARQSGDGVEGGGPEAGEDHPGEGAQDHRLGRVSQRAQRGRPSRKADIAVYRPSAMTLESTARPAKARNRRRGAVTAASTTRGSAERPRYSEAR